MCDWMIAAYRLRCEGPNAYSVRNCSQKGERCPIASVSGRGCLGRRQCADKVSSSAACGAALGPHHCPLDGSRGVQVVRWLPRCASLSFNENAQKRTPPLPWGGSKHKCRNAESRGTHACVRLRWCGADHIYVRRLGGTSCANCTGQDAGKRRTYKVAGVARMQVKGVPLLVPMR